MRNKKVDALIHQMENYSECWKQFSRYLNAARSKHFDQNDETQFLELKSLITQELELILAAVECSSPKKVEVHSLLGSAPSIRYLSELSDDDENEDDEEETHDIEENVNVLEIL